MENKEVIHQKIDYLNFVDFRSKPSQILHTLEVLGFKVSRVPVPEIMGERLTVYYDNEVVMRAEDYIEIIDMERPDYSNESYQLACRIHHECIQFLKRKIESFTDMVLRIAEETNERHNTAV